LTQFTKPPAAESAAQTLSVPQAPKGLTLIHKLVNLSLIVLPFLGLVAGVILLWGWGFGWVELGLLVGMYLLTALGVTVGFHRLFTHGSFETHPVVKFILAVLGSMAAQGPLLDWVGLHRHHHKHSDQEGDPHSPHLHGKGIFGMLRGLWYAHIGWMFRPGPQGLARYVKDLRRSASLRVASALFPLWVALGLLIPALLGGLLTWSWMGALLGLLWGGLARMFLFHHVSWGVNSICHFWGGQPHESGDHSTNNIVLGIVALGEGWHNNHHAFPTSARHGLRWWQIDVSYYVIRSLALLGLAWKVRLPAAPSGVGAQG
jgi:stearoyl-CoA desaturase (Delta-9 desaturase)